MKTSTFGVAMRMLFAKKQRLILTCIGIAISFGLLILISTLYVSMERSVQKTIEEVHGNFDVMVGYSPYDNRAHTKLLAQEDTSFLRNMEGVKDSGVAIIAPELLTDRFDPAARAQEGVNYFGVEPNEFTRNYYGFTTALQPDEMVISEAVATLWGVRPGDSKSFSINEDMVFIKTVGEIIPDYTSGPAVIMHIDVIRQAYGWGEVANVVYLDLAEGISEQAVEATIRAEFGGEINIALRSQDNEVIQQLTLFRFMAIGLGSLFMLVSILFLSSSFKLMLRGRVRELSTFRMIGASKRVIYKMVMMEAAVLNLLGVVLGVGAGILLCVISTQFIDSMMGIALHNVEIDWKSVGSIAVIGWLLLTLSVMRTARIAAATAPLVAVRYSEQERLNSFTAWVAGGLVIGGGVLLYLASFDIVGGDARLLFTLAGGLLAAGGCIFATGYIIPIVTSVSGWFIRRLGIAEAYYAMKQFTALRRQNAFVVMLLASIVTALIAIPTFIDNLNRAVTDEVLRKHMTPIVIEKRLGEMSANVVAQVRQIEGVDQALPFGTFHAVLLADMDYERADPKWLKQNSHHPEYLKGTPLYNTYEYEWLAVAQTDLQLMQQMGLIEFAENEFASGVVIQSRHAAHLGVSTGDSVSLQRTSLGKKSDTYRVEVSGVTELSFTTQERLSLVDFRNAKVSWIGNENDEKSDGIAPKRIYVQVGKHADIATVKTALEKLLENDLSIKVTDLDSELLRIAEQTKEQYTILWSLMAVFIIVGTVGVMNTMGATFHAHRREYAILRAIRLTTARLRSVMVLQGFLYASTAVVTGCIASGWIVVGLISGGDEFKGWTINWFTVALPIILVGVLTLFVSFLYARKLGLKSITEELTVE